MSTESKFTENLLNSIVTGIINFFLPLIIPAIYSCVIGQNHGYSMIETMLKIPNFIYLLLCIPFCYWAIRKIIKGKINEGISWVIGLNNEKYEDIGVIEYNKLLWIIQIDTYTKRHTELNLSLNKNKTFQVLMDNIRIKSDPRCSKCGAELYFTQHDLWYTYDCINPKCSFKKRTWQSNDKMKNIAKKQYKYELETEFYEKYNQNVSKKQKK